MQNLDEKFYLSHLLRRINVGGIDWEYIISGKGDKTIVIFPGGGQTAQGNFRLIEELERKYKVIAINIYNCDSIDDFNSVINKILETEKVNKVNLYGLSLGGLLAQSYLLRNKNRVESIILSHACTPKSITYKNKIIKPLRLLKVFLPLIPFLVIKWFTITFAKRFQGGSNKSHNEIISKLDPRTVELNTLFLQEFRNKYLTKRILTTWINLHLDFYNNEKFSNNTFKDWRRRVLIIRTDNDPLMQDEGDFKIVYPNAKVYTLKSTGHLTFYYKFDEIVRVIKKFLNKL